MSELTIDPQEIAAALRTHMADWEPGLEAETVGEVISIGDGVARVSGLPNAMASELLEFPGGLIGVALNLDEDSIGVVIMGEASHIQEGDPVKQTGRVLSVPVGDGLLGRVIDPLGVPMDGKGPIETTETPIHGVRRPFGRGAPAGHRAAADRHQGHRRHDPDRPGPARADHRRPQHRQDRGGPRHDHQPARHRCEVHLRGHRSEVLDGR